MKETYYLTGQQPERYKPMLDALVDLRIKDMGILLNELREQASGLEKPSIEYDLIKIRYRDVETGIKFWIELKYEGDVEHE